MPRQDGGSTVDLFQQHDPHQLMRPGCPAESHAHLGAFQQAWRKSICSADNEISRHPILRSPLTHEARKRRAVEILAALVQTDNDRTLRKDRGNRNRFLDPASLDILRAALANLDDFDIAKAQCTTRRLGALAVRRGEFPLRTLLEAADRRDHDTHGYDRRRLDQFPIR